MCLGPAGARQSSPPARRALLQQRYVPLGVGQQSAELLTQIAVHLSVSLVALRHPQQPRTPGEEPGVGRAVTPVEDVPGDGFDLHGRSIRCLKQDFLTGEELAAFELAMLIDLAAALKAARGGRNLSRARGQTPYTR